MNIPITLMSQWSFWIGAAHNLPYSGESFEGRLVMGLLSHFRGVRFGKGVVHFGQTGVDIRMDKAFFKSALSIVKINTVIKWRTLTGGQSEGTLAFMPQAPGPWYNARYAGHLAGFKFVTDAAKADCVFVFDDKTYSEAGQPYLETSSINARISDISKTYVAKVFEDVFGYGVGVDPLTYQGRAVQKSDANGTHDGVIVDCPLRPEDLLLGSIYQKLIDSTPTDLQSEDLRVAYVGGEIPVVFHKFKDLDKRFGMTYAQVDIYDASDVFSAEEIRLLIEFCGVMGLDFGALDVLRDKHDGRIYVVDVNKTCMPVLSLPIKEQMQALDKLGQSLLRFVNSLKTA